MRSLGTAGKASLCDAGEVLCTGLFAQGCVGSRGRHPASDLFIPLSITTAANGKLLLAFINNTAGSSAEHASPHLAV